EIIYYYFIGDASMFTLAEDPAKLQREAARALGNLFRFAGLDPTPCEEQVQKTRLFEAIIMRQKEQGIVLEVWKHWAELERYAAEQGYLGDAAYMSSIEGQLKAGTLHCPQIVLSVPVQ